MLNIVEIALAGPAAIILLITVFFIPGLKAARRMKWGKLIKLKLWEVERGLAGLVLSVTLAFFITQGVKNLVGRPRPNFLEKCQPDFGDVIEHLVSKHIVSGLEDSELWEGGGLVSSGICQAEKEEVDAAYRSFPSGHASFAWAGMVYLSLYLCAKFGVGIPRVPSGGMRKEGEGAKGRSPSDTSSSSSGDNGAGGDLEMLSIRPPAVTILPLTNDIAPAARNPKIPEEEEEKKKQELSIRNLAATPPTYLLFLALAPLAVAIYISTTRYKEFFHFGTDILAGSSLGILSAWFSFRWFHMPLGQTGGWAWGARNPRNAFGVGVGGYGYADE